MDALGSSARHGLDPVVATTPWPSRPRWVSASDLGEYTYCPRALWYREHPPAGGPSPTSLRSAEAGERFHARSLDGERTRERGAAIYAALFVLALALVAVGLLGALA